jgi:ATP-dependent DNA helicase DinG
VEVCYDPEALEEVEVWLDNDGDEVRSAGQRGAELAALGRRAAGLRADLGAMVEPAAGKDWVRWLAAGSRGVALHASPVDVAPALAAAFREQPGAIIFTSATLGVGGSFAYVRERLGLHDTADEAVFSSPFRYGRQALLYLPGDLPDPRDPRFPIAVAERAAELCEITGGRALLLFTSFRNLRAVEEILRARLRFPLLVQGERPRHVLLDALRTRVGSVLLATQSFWEGVDVPGEALSLVVIDKVPFDVPDDPLIAARIERIRESAGDPFATYQVPRAALSLKQGFGRLVRSRSDRGVVAILDGRLATRHYGAALLGGLPPECPRTELLQDVAEFWSRARGGGAPEIPR